MYRLIQINNELASIFKQSDNKWIPIDETNTDYQAYLRWLAEGNTPLPADDDVPLPSDA